MLRFKSLFTFHIFLIRQLESHGDTTILALIWDWLSFMTLRKCGLRVLVHHLNLNYQVWVIPNRDFRWPEMDRKLTGSGQEVMIYHRHFLSNIDENSIWWSIGSKIQNGGTIPWNVRPKSSWKVSILSLFYHFVTISWRLSPFSMTLPSSNT